MFALALALALSLSLCPVSGLCLCLWALSLSLASLWALSLSLGPVSVSGADVKAAKDRLLEERALLGTWDLGLGVLQPPPPFNPEGGGAIPEQQPIVPGQGIARAGIQEQLSGCSSAGPS